MQEIQSIWKQGSVPYFKCADGVTYTLKKLSKTRIDEIQMQVSKSIIAQEDQIKINLRYLTAYKQISSAGFSDKRIKYQNLLFQNGYLSQAQINMKLKKADLCEIIENDIQTLLRGDVSK